MNVLLLPFMLLAAAGFVLSAAVHGLSIAGMRIPGAGLVWTLHMGIFVVWIPAVLVSLGSTRHASRKEYWRVVLAGCPVSMRRGLYVLFGYAVLNFVIFLVTTVNLPKSPNRAALPSVIRAFSGHWMAFYAAAFAILFSRIHAPDRPRERKCPQGHAVSPTAGYCPECGLALSAPLVNPGRGG